MKIDKNLIDARDYLIQVIVSDIVETRSTGPPYPHGVGGNKSVLQMEVSSNSITLVEDIIR